MNPNEALRFAMIAGEIMLSSGAETFRAEDTIKRILINSNFEIAESFVTTTGIFASVKDEKYGNITMIKRVKSRINNYDKIVMTNDVSRRFAEGKITIEQGIEELSEIKVKPPYSLLTKTGCTAVVTLSFTFMFGGNIADCLNAFIAGFILSLLLSQLEKYKVNNVLSIIIGSSVATLISLILHKLMLGSNIDKIIIGLIMPLLPGVAFTNAIRDIMEGDYLSGTARILDALLVAVSIASGVALVLKIWMFMFGGVLI